jgi:hypothetical protein
MDLREQVEKRINGFCPGMIQHLSATKVSKILRRKVIKDRQSLVTVRVDSSNGTVNLVAMTRCVSSFFLLGATLWSTTYAIGPDCVNGPLKDNKICDVNTIPTERAMALVAAMETQEKLDNLMRWAFKAISSNQ